jgi:hypothetical protein
LASVADLPPVAIVHRGSGWGALDRIERAEADRAVTSTPGLPFNDDTLTNEQAPWLTLVTEGHLPSSDPVRPPPSYVVGAAWRARLEASPPSWQRSLPPRSH